MKIKMANENDIQNCVSELMIAMNEFSEFKVKGVFVTAKHYEQLVNLCIKNGMVILAEDNNKIVGSIMGLLNTNIVTGLNELITTINWVHPNRRNSSIFYRMHKLYEREYKKLKQQNKIDRVLMTSLPNKTNIKFEKLGYQVAETTYEWRS
jgi:hypothetical protein